MAENIKQGFGMTKQIIRLFCNLILERLNRDLFPFE